MTVINVIGFYFKSVATIGRLIANQSHNSSPFNTVGSDEVSVNVSCDKMRSFVTRHVPHKLFAMLMKQNIVDCN